MTRTGTAQRQTFAWPLALILLPILVLAGLGIFALRLDRKAVTREAQAQARELSLAVATHVETLLQQLQSVPDLPNAFTFRTNLDFFVVNASNQLVSPVPLRWPPDPEPLPLDRLSVTKLEQWTNATAAFETQAWQPAAELYLAFLEGRRTLGTNLLADQQGGIGSRQFRSLAQFRRGLACERLGQTNEAIAAWNDLFDEFILREAGCSEAGLPWKHLAALKILNLAGDQVNQLPTAWRRNPFALLLHLSQEASPYGNELFQRLAALAPRLSEAGSPPLSADQVIEPWRRVEQARRFHAEAAAARRGGQSPWPFAFWVEGESPWLAVQQRPPASHTNSVPSAGYGVFPERWLREEIQSVARREDRRSRFQVAVELAGRSITAGPSELQPPAGDQAFSFSTPLDSAGFPATVTTVLANPAAWFADQQRRQILFSTLVAASLLAGLGAAWATRRALLKQQRLAEMRSNFVSSVSHELRAPIASVRLMAESLERGKIPEPARQGEYFRFIGQECRRLSALIENVLDFSRIEQGRKQYEFEPTDLTAVVEQTVKLMHPTAAERQINLAISLPNPPPTDGRLHATVDGRAIQQALVNLIDNALKHSPGGSVVTVGAEAAGVPPDKSPPEPGASRIDLWVEDHGDGIPAEEHERIFERFYRRGSELRRATQGVGIGLSIVKHIVEAHGGRVTVKSAVGQGSRFTIELPSQPAPRACH